MIRQAFVSSLLAASALLFGSLTVVVRPVASRTIGLVWSVARLFDQIARVRTYGGSLQNRAYQAGGVLIESTGGGKRKNTRDE